MHNIHNILHITYSGRNIGHMFKIEKSVQKQILHFVWF